MLRPSRSPRLFSQTTRASEASFGGSASSFSASTVTGPPSLSLIYHCDGVPESYEPHAGTKWQSSVRAGLSLHITLSIMMLIPQGDRGQWRFGAQPWWQFELRRLGSNDRPRPTPITAKSSHCAKGASLENEIRRAPRRHWSTAAWKKVQSQKLNFFRSLRRAESKTRRGRTIGRKLSPDFLDMGVSS